jgi:hypothetical protein
MTSRAYDNTYSYQNLISNSPKIKSSKGINTSRSKVKKQALSKYGTKYDKKGNKHSVNNIVIPSSKIHIPTTSEISL